MIIKQLFQGKDYQHTLRLRLGVFIGMTALGILLLALTFTVLISSGLPSFAQGFYAGAGTSLTICGILFILKTLKLMRDPAAARLAQISEQDEREQVILRKAAFAVFWCLYAILIPGIVISLPLNMTVFTVLCSMLGLMSFLFFLSILWYRKRM